MQDVAGYSSPYRKDFAGHVLTVLNHGALCLMLSASHRTERLDVLRTVPPAIAAEMATRARLQERYVRA